MMAARLDRTLQSGPTHVVADDPADDGEYRGAGAIQETARTANQGHNAIRVESLKAVASLACRGLVFLWLVCGWG